MFKVRSLKFLLNVRAATDTELRVAMHAICDEMYRRKIENNTQSSYMADKAVDRSITCNKCGSEFYTVATTHTICPFCEHHVTIRDKVKVVY